METYFFTLKNPPVDFGFGVHNNGRCIQLSLVFVDVLINLNHKGSKGFAISVGVPFWIAAGFIYSNAPLEGEK